MNKPGLYEKRGWIIVDEENYWHSYIPEGSATEEEVLEEAEEIAKDTGRTVSVFRFVAEAEIKP